MENAIANLNYYDSHDEDDEPFEWDCVLYITNLIRGSLETPNYRGLPVAPEIAVLMTLRFNATVSFQVQQLQRNEQDGTTLGNEIDNRPLFEENEDLLHLFEKFQEIGSKHELTTSAELAEHATKVMHTLDEGIKSIKDIDAFFAYIRHVGATHHQVPGFKADNFWKIEQPFLEAAKMTLGDRYTPNIENIYKITIRFILENLVIGYQESEERNGGKVSNEGDS